MLGLEMRPQPTTYHTLAQTRVLEPKPVLNRPEFGSCFPKLDAALKRFGTSAVDRVTRRITTDYHSYADLLLCLAYPRWKQHCMKFYKGEGPLFQKCKGVDRKLIREYDRVLSRVVLACLAVTGRSASAETVISITKTLS